MQLFSLAGKVAIVTGSTRGIGRAIVEQLALAGAKVVVSSRNAQACDKTRAELSAAGHDAIAVPCNVGYKEQCERLVQTTLDTWSRVDVLVLNAAINPHIGPMQEMSDEIFDKMIATNVKAQLWLCQLVCPQMAERGEGSIIVISSITGVRGADTLGAYGISKAADMQLVRNVAVELGPHNVRINTIAPGVIRTSFARALWENPAIVERVEGRSPLRRFGEPDDVAGLAVCLAGPAGRFVTGQTWVVDGGDTVA